MAPILGIWASSKAVATDTGAMFPLQVITVGPAGASSISFTNIPNTYTHLQVRAIGRDDRSSVSINTVYLQFNSDTGSNYSYHALYGSGTSALATGLASNTFAVNHQNTSASATANTFAASVIDILDYANTSKYKTIRSISGYDDNSTGRIAMWSSLWQSTSAITSIVFTPSSSASFNQYSQFALYAIKGA